MRVYQNLSTRCLRTPSFQGMVWVSVLLAMQVGVCLPLEAKLDVVSRILHEVPLIDGHNDLPWNIRKFLKNQLKDFRFSEDLREVAPWSRSAWSHTDLGRLRKGMVAAQFWSAYVPCSSQHLDSVQLTLEQIDVIRRLVAKYPGHMALVTTAQGIKRAHESGRIASLIGIEGGHAIGTSLGVLRMFYQLGARYLTITHTCNTPCKEGPPSFGMKAMLGITAGAVGAFVGTPAEVCLIRMTTDARLPSSLRRNYKNVVDALIRIVKEEGVTTLWRGCIATVVRACVVNAAQLATYSQAKEMLVSRNFPEKSVTTHFLSAMISGFFTAFFSNPLDTVKTRIQNMKTINGVPEYKGNMDAVMKIVGKEGVLAFWKGFVPYYTRIGPHTVFTFIFLEQLNAAYRRYN